MTTPPTIPAAEQVTRPWQDAGRSVEERADLLLAEMTLEERVGQLGSRWVGNDMPDTGGALGSAEGPETDGHESLNVAPMQDVFAAAGSPSLEEASR